LGFARVVHDGASACQRLAESEYDIVVLDVMIPRRNGLDVCRQLRLSRKETLVLMLTACDGADARIDGLDSGADDYMTKPFALAELTARLRALWRRGAARENVLRLGDLHVDTIKRSVRRGAKT